MTRTVSATLPPVRDPLPTDTRPWQRQRLTQIVCALALILPMAAIASWVYAAQEGEITVFELLVWPLLGGGTLIFWIVFLHLIVCGDSLDRFGFRLPRIGLDLLFGIGLAAATLAFHVFFTPVLARLFPPRPPAPEIVELITGLAHRPVLLAIWLGPVVWIGIALFEELARAFLLRRLVLSWSGATGYWPVILVVAALNGLAHVYQGPAAVLGIGIKSVLLGWFYMRSGRIRALIVCHALYDSIQIVHAVIVIRSL